MMARGVSIDGAAGRGRGLQSVAFAVLLACLSGRVVLCESAFRTSPLMGIDLRGLVEGDGGKAASPERAELAGMAFVVLIFSAGALWLAGAAVSGRLRVRCAPLAAAIVVFAAVSLVSALGASDRRGALEFWAHQVSLMFAGFLAVQLCADRRRFAVLLAVLAALGMMLAAKGIWQYFVEAPDRIADFEANRDRILSAHGLAVGSPEAAMFEIRLRDRAPLGFFGLANPFASLLIVLGAAGAALTAGKWVHARRDRRITPEARRKGDVHLPTLAAVVTAVLPLAAAAVVLLTRSLGAIGSAVAAAAAAIVVPRFRERLARRWRRSALFVGGVFLGAAATVAAYGLIHDRLPGKTMTFRWYYWTGAARIVADRPLLGVGPGNFGAAYLRVRRPEALEEAVKTPHNFIVHALAQYGVPGGACYVLIVGWLLVSACRPSPGARNDPGLAAPASRAGLPAVGAAVCLAPLLAQAIFTDARGSFWQLLQNGVEPAVVLGAALAAAWWYARKALDERTRPYAARVILACGLTGFILHNTVTLSLWMPGAAMAFWLAGGACIAQAGGRDRDLSILRWPLLIAAVLLVAAAVSQLWGPLRARAVGYNRVCSGIARRDWADTLGAARELGRADPLDPVSAADAARLFRVAMAFAADPDQAAGHRDEAYRWAREAIARDKANPSYHRLAAGILWPDPRRPLLRDADTDAAINHAAQAVVRNPQRMRARIDFAQMLLSAGRAEEAPAQLGAADEINRRLPADSLFLLGSAERRRVERLRAAAKAAIAARGGR